MQKLNAILLILVGIIHLLPLSGVLGANKLAALYAIDVSDPNLAILLQHRAVLFGLLGCFLIYAAFNHEVKRLAIIAGFISVVSFLIIAWMHGDYNAAIRKVVIADIIALVMLSAAGAQLMIQSNSEQFSSH